MSRAQRKLADPNDPAVQAKITAEKVVIQALPLADLRERWVARYRCPVPGKLGRIFLTRALAWQYEVDLCGDLPPAILNDLKVALHSAVAAIDARCPEPETLPPASGRLTPGTRIVREWRGTTYVVEVKEDGLWWQGHRYGSLSAVAKAITGTHWNGLLFFGLRERRERTVKRLAKAGAQTSAASPVRRVARG